MRRYLFILGVPQRDSIDLIDDVTGTEEVVHVSLTAGRQVEDKDPPTEIPEGGRDCEWTYWVERKYSVAWTIRTATPSPPPDRAPRHTSHTPGDVEKPLSACLSHSADRVISKNLRHIVVTPCVWKTIIFDLFFSFLPVGASSHPENCNSDVKRPELN